MKRTLKYALSMVLTAAIIAPAFAQDQFPDVPENHWAYEALKAMKTNGLLVGYPDGLFRGGRPASRYEMAVAVHATWAKLKGITDGLQTQIDALKEVVNGMKGQGGGDGASKADLEAVVAQLNALKADMAKMNGWGDDINNLKKMSNEFQKELASMGVDISQMQNSLKDLATRVGVLEKNKLPISFSGDVNLLMLNGYGNDSGNYGVTVDGRPTGVGRRTSGNPAGPAGQPTTGLGGLFEDASTYHEASLTLTSTNDSGPTFKTTMVMGNMMNFGGFVNQTAVTPRVPFADGGANQIYFSEFSVNYDTSVMGLAFNAKAGRVGYKISPYIYQRPDITPYFANDRWDNHEFTMDGAVLGFNFGGAKVDFIVGRNNNETTNTGAGVQPLFAGGTEAQYIPGLGGPTARPIGYNGATAMLIDRTVGAHVGIPVSGMGNLGLSYLYLASNFGTGANSLPGLGVNQIANGVTVFGADLDLKFSQFMLNAGYAQSNLQDGSTNRISSDNNAFNAKLTYTGGGDKWGAYLGYRYIAPRFGAPGDWGRIGMWNNPSDIQGLMLGANFKVNDRISLDASGEFYTGTDKTLTAVTAGTPAAPVQYKALGKDDKISSLKINLGYRINESWNAMLGYESVGWDLAARAASATTFAFAGGKPRENWFNIGLGYTMSDKAKFTIMYQISDYDSKGTPGFGLANPGGVVPIGGIATTAKGGLIATQLSIKF